MSGLFAGTSLERPVTCEVCGKPLAECGCPRDGEGRVCLPSEQPVVIRLQKRKKGKTVTVIEGMDPNASDLKAILKKLKSVCGSGGTISIGAIEVQGDHREKAAGVLKGMGYEAKTVG